MSDSVFFPLQINSNFNITLRFIVKLFITEKYFCFNGERGHDQTNSHLETWQYQQKQLEALFRKKTFETALSEYKLIDEFM